MNDPSGPAGSVVRRLGGVSVAVFSARERPRSAAERARAPSAASRPAILLGHGAGGDFRDPLLSAVASGLAARGWCTCTFNFPYREAQRRVPDRGPRLEAALVEVAAALRAALDLAPGDLVLGGKSMGGRMASQAVAHGLIDCRGLLLLCYPLHPPRRPEQLRVGHLAAIAAPMLFVSGTRDPLARRDLLEEHVAALGERARLHLIPDADHGLAVPRRAGRRREDVLGEVVETAAAWLERLR